MSVSATVTSYSMSADMQSPEIIVVDDTPVKIASGIGVPRKFVALFENNDRPRSILEIEVRDGKPRVVRLTIEAGDDHLTTSNTRLPLTGELLPAAVAKASFSHRGKGLRDQVTRKVSQEEIEQMGDAVIGPMNVVGRVRQHLGAYQASAYGSQTRTGRPRENDPEELAAVVAAYERRQKIVDVVDDCPWLKPWSARRRVERCVELGLLPAKDDDDGTR